MSESAGPAIGERGEPFEVVIEAGKVREFAQATKAHTDAWFGPGAVSPPTYLTADRFWASLENQVLEKGNVNWARILHGEEEFIFHGPPPAVGQHLTAQQTVENVYEKQGRRGGSMKFVVVLTEYRDPDGELVVEARHTVIETSQAATA
jgi:hydroxyacyl-ACP dehydratase HTD2-like protein with hotdog domain